MEIWEFSIDQEEWNINVEMHGNVIKNASEMYFTVITSYSIHYTKLYDHL